MKSSRLESHGTQAGTGARPDFLHPSERELQALMELPEPEAPPYLLDEVLAEIPDELPGLSLDEPTSVSRGAKRVGSAPWRVAAALAILALGSWLTARLTQRTEPAPEKRRWVAQSVLTERPAAAELAAELPRALPEGYPPLERRFAPAPVPPPPSATAAPQTAAPGPSRAVYDEITVTESAPPASLRSSAVSTVKSFPEPSPHSTRPREEAPYADLFFDTWGTHPFIDTEEDPLSTFGLDVDTASYAIVRSYLEDGYFPYRSEVRVEEMVNAFDFGLAAPRGGSDFEFTVDGGPTPFTGTGATLKQGRGSDRFRLLRLGLRARDIAPAARKPARLTLVVDVSGSMEGADRLGLVQQSLKLLLEELNDDDEVALVVYGSRGRVLEAHTRDLERIRAALDGLEAGGSTYAEEGLVLAYELASRNLLEGGINRVILCSDGVANVGATGPEAILARVELAASRGIELSTFGFGMEEYNDVLMEQLANRGDGNYAYIDSLEEARRVFVHDLTGVLQTVAHEARIQVEFRPGAVERYRLLGYENREIADEDFRDDRVDAGEVGAGHQVTALYEIELARRFSLLGSLGVARLRYRPADSEEFVERKVTLRRRHLERRWGAVSTPARQAAIVAEFAEILRRSPHSRGTALLELLKEAEALEVPEPAREQHGELIRLIRRAHGLQEALGPEER